MQRTVGRNGASWLRKLAVIGCVATAGAMIGSVSQPVQAQAACEDDECSRVCTGGFCSGECYDSPNSGRKCNMVGSNCAEGGCDPT
jgi:hypothetical protein